MAWNPSPKVADCRDIARKWGHKHQVIILAVDRNKGTLQLATYGETKALCADAKRLGDAAYQTIFDNYDPDVPLTSAPDEDTGTRCIVCGGPFNPANATALLRQADKDNSMKKKATLDCRKQEPIVRPCSCGQIPRHFVDKYRMHGYRCDCGESVNFHASKARALAVWNGPNAQAVRTGGPTT